MVRDEPGILSKHDLNMPRHLAQHWAMSRPPTRFIVTSGPFMEFPCR